VTASWRTIELPDDAWWSAVADLRDPVSPQTETPLPETPPPNPNSNPNPNPDPNRNPNPRGFLYRGDYPEGPD